jgi:signal transduction histidine kinase
MPRPPQSESQRTTWALGLLQSIADTAAAAGDSLQVLQRAADQIAVAFGDVPVRLRLRTGSGSTTALAASAGRPNEQGDRDASGRGPMSRVLADGVSVRLDDLHRRDAAGPQTDTSASWRSLVAAPIICGTEVLGALTVGSTEPHRFSEPDEQLLVSIGRVLGVVAHAHRLGDLVRELRTETQVLTDELRATNDRLRATQEQVVEAGKLSALGQLVAGVAHELNNPLTSVMGYAQLVLQQVARPPDTGLVAAELHDDLAHIHLEAERAARIVRNLLLFARRQKAARAQHDLAFLCEQVLELRAYDLGVSGIDITSEFAPDLPQVLIDPSQVQQAVLNLVLNAEHALVGRPVRRLWVRGMSDPPCGALRLEIRDSGHGITPAILERVFDPFFTTRPAGQGTGLGLSIVSGVVRDHGGEIWVESEPDVGTSFFLRFPAVQSSGTGEPWGRALVGSTNALLRDFIAAALAGWGLPVTATRSARETFDRLDAEPVRLVVVDRSVVEADLGRWQELFAARDGYRRLVAVSPGAPADAIEAFFKTEARWTIPSPPNLCQLREAVVAATHPGSMSPLPVPPRTRPR